jgi:hypothetical protein
MAKKTEAKGKISGRKLLEAARTHLDALQAKGLSVTVLDRLDIALSGIENERKGPNPAAQVLMKDISREVGEFQQAIRKEFPGNAQFQSFFKANEPMPADARGILHVGRQVAAEAPNFAANLIRYAINAATVKHLGFLCDQLAKEIGGSDPHKDAGELEAQIREVAKLAFEGQPQLAEFGEG